MRRLPLPLHQLVNLCLYAVQRTEELSSGVPIDSSYWQANTHDSANSLMSHHWIGLKGMLANY